MIRPRRVLFCAPEPILLNSQSLVNSLLNMGFVVMKATDPATMINNLPKEKGRYDLMIVVAPGGWLDKLTTPTGETTPVAYFYLDKEPGNIWFWDKSHKYDSEKRFKAAVRTISLGI